MTNDIIDIMSQSTFDARDVLEAFLVSGMFHVKQCKKFRLWQPENENQDTLPLENVIQVNEKIIFLEKLTKLLNEAEEVILAGYEGQNEFASLQEKVSELNEEYEPQEDDLSTLEEIFNFFQQAYNLKDGFTFKELQEEVENKCRFVDSTEIYSEAKEKAYEYGFVKEGSPIENCIDWDEWAEQYKNDMDEIKHPYRENITLYFN